MELGFDKAEDMVVKIDCREKKKRDISPGRPCRAREWMGK